MLEDFLLDANPGYFAFDFLEMDESGVLFVAPYTSSDGNFNVMFAQVYISNEQNIDLTKGSILYSSGDESESLV